MGTDMCEEKTSEQSESRDLASDGSSTNGDMSPSSTDSGHASAVSTPEAPLTPHEERSSTRMLFWSINYTDFKPLNYTKSIMLPWSIRYWCDFLSVGQLSRSEWRRICFRFYFSRQTINWWVGYLLERYGLSNSNCGAQRRAFWPSGCLLISNVHIFLEPINLTFAIGSIWVYLQVNAGEMVQELHQVLLERDSTSHRTCFSLQLDGVAMDHFTELKNIEGMKDGVVLKVVEGQNLVFLFKLRVLLP